VQLGFRDQLQDTIGLKNIDINFMKNQILIQAKHQFIEGDVLHWWHEETRKRYKNKIFR
jgi:cyclic beta-1,2-glucan synthetase